MKAEVFLKAQAMLGEGPLWDDRRGCLFFVDIEGRKLNRVTMEGEMTSYPMPSRIGTVGLTQSGRLIIALEDGLHFFDPDTGRDEFFVQPEDGRPENRGNDGKPDPAGNMWQGTMPMVQDKVGGLYRIAPDGSSRCVIDGLGCANGLGWSPDGKTMYFIDTPSRAVWAFDYDEKAGEINLNSRRTVVDFTAFAPEEGGPDGMFPATELAGSLKELGISLRRFKTGTPARVLRSSIDFTDLEVQKGDEPVTPFSFDTEVPPKNSAVCHVSWTNDRTKQVILDNIHRSPLYAGMIEGVGPRYCPSIEDKIMRFSEKPRHQLFIEPCGAETEEMYLQGMSSSLPEEVQIAFYRTIKGLEHVEIMRNAYAIEYDCCDPLQLNATLEFRDYPGLYGAGQFNGSSGYEEAAAQGFVAGANAALKVLNRDPLILDRAGSYIGTLIDDLITKGVTDPYRMMTSRSEYRLVLRQDNADERLTPIGRELGLIDDRRWAKFEKKQAQKEAEMKRAEKTVFSPTDALNEVLVSCETSPVTTGVRLSELLRRPQVTYADLTPIDIERPNYPREIFESVETALKYEGYIKRQLQDIAEMRRLEKKLLPKEINYAEISGLRLEAQEKLNRVRPENVGQAGRISGVSPADISVLLIWLSAHNEGK